MNELACLEGTWPNADAKVEGPPAWPVQVEDVDCIANYVSPIIKSFCNHHGSVKPICN